MVDPPGRIRDKELPMKRACFGVRRGGGRVVLGGGGFRSRGGDGVGMCAGAGRTCRSPRVGRADRRPAATGTAGAGAHLRRLRRGGQADGRVLRRQRPDRLRRRGRPRRRSTAAATWSSATTSHPAPRPDRTTWCSGRARPTPATGRSSPAPATQATGRYSAALGYDNDATGAYSEVTGGEENAASRRVRQHSGRAREPGLGGAQLGQRRLLEPGRRRQRSAPRRVPARPAAP